MRTVFPTDAFRQLTTPFYYYDTDLLRATIRTIQEEVSKHPGFCVHYAVKANANPRLLNIIGQSGLGADCVSGGEILAALGAGIPKHRIVYAGRVNILSFLPVHPVDDGQLWGQWCADAPAIGDTGTAEPQR